MRAIHFFCAVLSLANAALIELDSNVMELQTGNWDAHMRSGERYFIKFFAPWCAHCKRMKPVWEKLATDIQSHAVMHTARAGGGPLLVRIAEVDCTKHEEVCTKVEIKGYPTLLYVNKVGEIFTYNGQTDRDSMVAFLRKQIEEEEGIGEHGAKKEEKKRKEVEELLVAAREAREQKASSGSGKTTSSSSEKSAAGKTGSNNSNSGTSSGDSTSTSSSAALNRERMSKAAAFAYDLFEACLPAPLFKLLMDVLSLFSVLFVERLMLPQYLGKVYAFLSGLFSVAWIVIVEVIICKLLNRLSPFRVPAHFLPGTDAFDEEEEITFIRNLYFWSLLFFGLFYWRVNKCYSIRP